MAEISSSSSVSERTTSQGKTDQQEKEEPLRCSIIDVPKKPIKLYAEVCHLSVFHFLNFILKLFLPFQLN